jgi:hypothetical protein
MVNARPLTKQAGVHFRASPWEVYGGQSVTRTGSSPSTSVYPVSIILPTLHTQSRIHHRRYMLAVDSVAEQHTEKRKLKFARLVKKFSWFVEPEGSLQVAPNHATFRSG